MLESYTDGMLFHLAKGDSFFLMPPSGDPVWASLPGDVRSRALREAERWARQPIPSPTARDRMACAMGQGDEYSDLSEARRQMLRAIALGLLMEPRDHLVGALIDVAWAICEESSWTMPQNDSATAAGIPSLPDVAHPKIDRAAAQTAADLCLVAQLTGDLLAEVAPQLLARIRREITLRILVPFGTLEGSEWMCGSRSSLAACLSGILLSIITYESNGRNRWQGMRRAWALLDGVLSRLNPDGSIDAGIGGWQETAEPIMRCLSIVATASGEAADARGEALVRYLCHYPVICHIANGTFVNRGPGGMKTAPDGLATFRIGRAVGDDALCDLGICLWKKQGLPAEGDDHRLLGDMIEDALNMPLIESATARPPFRRQAYLEHAQLLCARGAEDQERGMAFAMYGGANNLVGGCADTGNFLLFYGGSPILADVSGSQTAFNLPTIGGVGPGIGAGFRSEDAQCEMDDDYAMMSLNLRSAYPAQAGLLNWQRTLIYRRDQGEAQLIEVFDLEGESTVEFGFVCAVQPSLGDRYAQIGAIRLRWEYGLTGEIAHQEGSDVWQIRLTPEEPIKVGKFTFRLTSLRTYG